MLPLCADLGVGVIPWSPLARGRLTRDWDATTARSETDEFGRTLYRDDDAAIVDAVATIAARRGVSRAQVALAWVSRHPTVDAPIIGATKPRPPRRRRGLTGPRAHRRRGRRAGTPLHPARHRRLRLTPGSGLNRSQGQKWPNRPDQPSGGPLEGDEAERRVRRDPRLPCTSAASARRCRSVRPSRRSRRPRHRRRRRRDGGRRRAPRWSGSRRGVEAPSRRARSARRPARRGGTSSARGSWPDRAGRHRGRRGCARRPPASQCPKYRLSGNTTRFPAKRSPPMCEHSQTSSDHARLAQGADERTAERRAARVVAPVRADERVAAVVASPNPASKPVPGGQRRRGG